MMRRFAPICLMLVLVSGVSARAQSEGGRGHGGRGGQPSSPAPPSSNAAQAPAVPPPKPENQIEIVGVVRAIDSGANQVTIAYDAVDELNWPPGTMPFTVYKSDLLKAITVGERVRFKLDSQRIVALTAY
jgi:Cu/Ag efflux protein CusF